MRRRSLARTIARTAVIAGTATAVSGHVRGPTRMRPRSRLVQGRATGSPRHGYAAARDDVVSHDIGTASKAEVFTS